MAAKSGNVSTDDIDRSSYDWVGQGVLNPGVKVKVPPCGACHPGSGSLEYARDAATGEATTTRLDDAALADPAALDGDFHVSVGRNTPPADNMFLVSGVVEADCLLCHLDPSSSSPYSFGGRFKQLTYRNYKWAPTAGAGLGSVSGKVYTFDATLKSGDGSYLLGDWIQDTDADPDGDVTDEAGYPAVTYTPATNDKISEDGGTGELLLNGSVMIGTPDASNCLYCHSGADAKKRGLKWNSDKDVHNAAGLICLDCHGMEGEAVEHNIGKGYARLGSVASGKGGGVNLDGTMHHDCEGCHSAAVEEDHIEYFGGRLHIDKIACESCHIPYLEDNMGYLIDMSSGNQVWMLRDGKTPAWAGDFGITTEGFTWGPFLKLYDPDGDTGPKAEKYYPFGTKTTTWFGFITTTADGDHVQPYILRHVKAAYNTLKGASALEKPSVTVTFADGTEGSKPNISTTADIVAMLTELEDNGPVAGTTAVFVRAEKAYKLNAAGDGVEETGLHGETDHNFSINHNVRSADEALGAPNALGAKGCTDCHSEGGALDNKQVTDVSGFLSSRTELLDEDAIAANGEPMFAFAGLTEEQGEQLLDQEAEASGDVGVGGSSSSECFIGSLATAGPGLGALGVLAALGAAAALGRKD